MTGTVAPRDEHPVPPRVELFSRAAVSGARTRQLEVRDRLAALEETGRIEGASLHSWQGRVRGPVDDDDPAAQAIEWYDRFESWADEAGVDLEPFFDCYERTSELAGETYEEIVFPVLCVAVVRDDRIETVAPHAHDDGTTTVEDCLDDLAGGTSGEDDRVDETGTEGSGTDGTRSDRTPLPAGR
jgi:hypothetical protein